MSKNNIQQTEWNKVDYYYGIGTLIDDNHLDYHLLRFWCTFAFTDVS